jgi:hypothetical protein
VTSKTRSKREAESKMNKGRQVRREGSDTTGSRIYKHDRKDKDKRVRCRKVSKSLITGTTWQHLVHQARGIRGRGTKHIRGAREKKFPEYHAQGMVQ